MTGELSGGDIALIAATVSAASAIITAMVTNIFTHLSATTREARARNSERLAELTIEFLSDFKSVDIAFRDWYTQCKIYKEIRDTLNDMQSLSDSELQKSIDIMAKVQDRAKIFVDHSVSLARYQSALEVYSPRRVRNAYESAISAVDNAAEMVMLNDDDMSEEVERASKGLKDSREEIVKALSWELRVKSRRGYKSDSQL